VGRAERPVLDVGRAVWNVEYVVYGALAVVVFGLSFAQAVLVILLGNLSSC
jgi:purine-cytosine permease-like protein